MLWLSSLRLMLAMIMFPCVWYLMNPGHVRPARECWERPGDGDDTDRAGDRGENPQRVYTFTLSPGPVVCDPGHGVPMFTLTRCRHTSPES